ncbi:MAG: LysR family transcriptional regulator [Proteobacteria bacterium]|nr:LysR family transcriptional regulator [Pseudomonadota bacterium]
MIELRHFRYFIAVAEDLNFRRAAERIHIDQTSLSRSVRDLEEQLGAPLFVRLPRTLQLTPAGVRLLREARKLLIRLERVKRNVRQTHALYQPPLRVGVADGIAQPKLSECLSGWHSVAPQVPLELLELRAGELLGALKSEEVDIGFSFGVADDDAIAQAPAWRYRLMAVLPHSHQLVNRKVVSLSDLLAFPLLSCNQERLPGLLWQMRTIVRKYIDRVTFAGEACTLSGYVTRIAAGAGVGLGDEGHAQTLRRSDVLALPLAEEEHITTFVLHKHQRFGLSEPLQRFLAYVRTLS